MGKQVIEFTTNKKEPIKGLREESLCVNEIFEFLRKVAQKEEYGITDFSQIKDATLKALLDLLICW